MIHRNSKPKLNRDLDHRKALLRNLSAQLIEHGKIITTLPKAKALRPFVEKLITKARNGYSLQTLQYFRKRLVSEEAIKKLLNEVGPKYLNRAGGYTRIHRVGNRDGDNAIKARIELVQEESEANAK